MILFTSLFIIHRSYSIILFMRSPGSLLLKRLPGRPTFAPDVFPLWRKICN
ncbi:MAG: hypothetical protein QOE33_591 [Acidobacteriota bacterium]|nr:hypothetical protein [Acidobacteriota bacterium]